GVAGGRGEVAGGIGDIVFAVGASCCALFATPAPSWWLALPPAHSDKKTPANASKPTPRSETPGRRPTLQRPALKFFTAINSFRGSRHNGGYKSHLLLILLMFFLLCFPRAMALRLMRALPGERRFLPPSSAKYLPPTWHHGRGARTTRLRRTLPRF